MRIQRASDRPLFSVATSQRKGEDMEEKKEVTFREGVELDDGIEPTAEEIAAAEKLAEEEAEG